MSTILNTILATKHEEVSQAMLSTPLEAMKDRAAASQMRYPVRDFIGALKARRLQELPGIIAEVKKASPSKGVIRHDFEPVSLAQAYEAGGAACLSVLTDRHYFQGAPEFLSAIRENTSLPILRKDFIVHEHQIYEARALGADCILLIAAALEADELARFEACAHDLGMAVLVELHDSREWAKCQLLTTELIGVNNRDLHTFAVTLNQTIQLLPALKGKTVVTESGITSLADIRHMQRHGVNNFLIGEHFMRQANVEAAVRQMMHQAA